MSANIINFSDFKKKRKTETCILCGKGTKIPCSLHIYDPRRNDTLNVHIGSHYVDGSGQLCDSCFDKVRSGKF